MKFFKLFIIFIILLTLFCGSAFAFADDNFANKTFNKTWVYGNAININSGGSSDLLKDKSSKMAIEYISPASRTVINISYLPAAYVPNNDGTTYYRIGIQSDNNGGPSGTYLSSATFNKYTDEFWQTTTIPNVNIVAGNRYWIVVQYDSGNAPDFNTNYNWLGIYAAEVTHYNCPYDIGDPYTHENPLPYNYSGSAGLNDMAATTVKYWTGSSWAYDANNRTLPCFLLGFSDGTSHGQPYCHKYLDYGIYGSYQEGQYFTVSNGNFLANELWMPWSISDTTGGKRPLDNLYYTIRIGGPSGALVDKGTFAYSANTTIFANSDSQELNRYWIHCELNKTVKFISGTQYFIYFSSPGSTASCCWQTDVSLARASNMYNTLCQSTWGGATDYRRRTENNWGDTRNYYDSDFAFLFNYTNLARWDVNKDGVVNSLDINEVAQHYGEITSAPYPDWDVDKSGVVDLRDIIIVNLHFGEQVA